MLISTHMQDLKDTTRDVHYENFRAQCISQISQHALRERNKLKRESIASSHDPQAQTPNNSINETDRLLQQKEEEVSAMTPVLHYSLQVFQPINLIQSRLDYSKVYIQVRIIKSHTKQKICIFLFS